jgi:hypothetical protein
VEVRDVDVDLLPRLDVRDGLCEDVVPLLRHERRDAALAALLLVDLLRLLALADHPPDRAVADDHDEVAHGGVVGQREDVHRLDLRVVRVVVLLFDGDGREVDRDLRLDVGVLERDRNELVGELRLELAAAGATFLEPACFDPLNDEGFVHRASKAARLTDEARESL